jgi:glycosyltransferase involved in cell wall biosynthesis
VTSTSKSATRVLQVIRSGLAWGGAEVWLMNVLRNIDRERFQIDFAVGPQGVRRTRADEAYALKARIFQCPNNRRPIAFARGFQQILHQHGPYDIVHSHDGFYTGYILRLARQSGVPVRIAHDHNDLSVIKERATTLQRIYIKAMSSLIVQNANLILAVSRKVADYWSEAPWELSPQRRILYCGIDLEPFRATLDRAGVRAELGIPAEAFVVGHVGNFRDEKNHTFLIDIAVEVAKREPNMRLLLVGTGPLRSAIERQLSLAGVADKVIFTGTRTDVPRLMLGAMNAFVFPSLYEGLGLAGVEAQAAGLPLIVSDVVPEEIGVVNSLVRRLALSQPASVWAEAVLATRKNAPPIIQQDALRLLENSRFNIVNSVKELTSIYAAQAPIGGQTSLECHRNA